MPRFDNFTANVSVDGVNLPEYNVATHRRSKTVTCYIPSEMGKRFSVNWEPARSTFYDATGDIVLDNISVGGHTLYAGARKRLCTSDRITSPTTSQPFMFSSLVLTDDDDAVDANSVEGFGNITLTIWKTKTIEEKEPDQEVLDPIEMVHERSKKTMTHQINFGEEMAHDYTAVFDSGSKLTYVVELVTFIFKYRSLDVLKAEGMSLAVPDARTVDRKRKIGKANRASVSWKDGATNGEFAVEMQDNDDKRRVKKKSKVQKVKAKPAKKSAKKGVKTNLERPIVKSES